MMSETSLAAIFNIVFIVFSDYKSALCSLQNIRKIQESMKKIEIAHSLTPQR